MARLGKILALTVLCALVSGILFCSQVADEPVSDAIAMTFGDYMSGGITADMVMTMAAEGNEYQPEGIHGAEFGTAGFLGETERGPEIPQLVTSYEQYTMIFGSHPGRSYMPYEVKGYFDNGGKKLYVARVISQTANTQPSSRRKKCLRHTSGQRRRGNRVAVKVLQNNSTESDPFMLEVLFTYGKFTSNPKPDRPSVS